MSLTRSIAVRLHNSVAEVGALALEFLEEFANSAIPAETTVRNFSNSCPGKAAELKDVTKNRATRIINSHMYGTPAVTVAFGGVVQIQDRGCLRRSHPVEWQSTVIATGADRKPQRGRAPSQVSTETRGGGCATAASTGHRAWVFTSCTDGRHVLSMVF